MSPKYKPLKSRQENKNGPVILLGKTFDFTLAALTVPVYLVITGIFDFLY